MPVNKWLRRLLYLVAVVMLALAASVTTIDRTPYFEAEYGQSARQQLNNLSRSTSLHSGPLSAGMAKISLTPDLRGDTEVWQAGTFPKLPLAGYSRRNGRPAIGVRDSLFVKALALDVDGQRLVLVTLDALIVPQEVADSLAVLAKQELGLQRAQLYLGATHTHSGPGGWGEGRIGENFAGPFTPGVRAWMVQQMFHAIKSAIGDLQPAKWGIAATEAPKHVRNRLVGDLGEVDTRMQILKVAQENGKEVIVACYAAHATLLDHHQMQFSADYPGFWREDVEAETGAMAMFFAGAVGSHGPRSRERSMSGAAEIGQALADSTISMLGQIKLASQAELAFVSMQLPLPEQHVRVRNAIRLRPWLSKTFLPVGETSWIQGARLGKLLWLSTPCDFSGELALDIRNAALAKGWETWITSFNGSYIGYIIPCRYYNYEHYESRMMSFFGPEMPDYLSRCLRDLQQILLDAG